MDYAEQPPGEDLAGLVKSFWRLDGGGDPAAWIDHRAVPDGCVELIARLHGRSHWGEEQPTLFATGLIDSPIAFAFSGDARFVAVRLWPWAWRLVSDVPLAAIHNGWAPIAAPVFASIEEAAAVIRPRLAGSPLAAMGRAIVGAATVGEMQDRTGLAPRALQRWFAAHVGLPPRHYLTLLRFQNAFEGLPGGGTLADHAAGHGFADQAHMARAFRDLAGVPASRARARAKGPFLR